VSTTLPARFEKFLTNVCELPDRNSPEDEPDAVIATLDDLRSCALSAIETQEAEDREAEYRAMDSAWHAAFPED
jgi:hypothetical protein